MSFAGAMMKPLSPTCFAIVAGAARIPIPSPRIMNHRGSESCRAGQYSNPNSSLTTLIKGRLEG